ncbi:MAG: aconitase family protein [Pirellulaceae bacterium]
MVHEVTSPQAFEGLRLNQRKVRRPERTVATPDHNIPTTDRSLPIIDEISRKQVDTLRENCEEFGIRLLRSEQSQARHRSRHRPRARPYQPGMTIVCGDSHTATHGAFGALAFGIGTSEVEHVLATQTLLQSKPKTFELRVDGELARGVTAKDLILYLIGRLHDRRWNRLRVGIHRRGDPRSFNGRADDGVQHVDRGGARAGMIAADQKTIDYLRDREFVPGDFGRASAQWASYHTDLQRDLRSK